MLSGASRDAFLNHVSSTLRACQGRGWEFERAWVKAVQSAPRKPKGWYGETGEEPALEFAYRQFRAAYIEREAA